MSEPAGASEGATPPGPMEASALVEVQAELDVPGETGRQARVFGIWLACLAVAVVLAAFARARIPEEREGSAWADDQLARSRLARLEIAAVAGLLAPAILAWALTRWYRRGGGQARGITVDVTAEGELRVWGRGYGSRLDLRGARVDERFVDVFTGRLGAWRQRRLRVRASGAIRRGSVSELELATTALERDLADELRAEGGEGDCIELDRESYDRVKAAITARV